MYLKSQVLEARRFQIRLFEFDAVRSIVKREKNNNTIQARSLENSHPVFPPKLPLYHYAHFGAHVGHSASFRSALQLQLNLVTAHDVNTGLS